MATLQSQLKLTVLDGVTGRMRGISAALSGFQARTRALSAPMMGVTSRLLALGAGYVGVTAGLRGTLGAAMKFEDAFADVRKVVSASDEQFANMSRTIKKMSTELPLTAVDIAALFAAAGEAGIATEDIKSFADMAAKVAIAFDMSAGQAGESLAKLKAQLGLTVAETGDMADAINHLSNNMASKAPEIVDYMLRVGKFAEMGGFHRDQIAAIGSAMISAGAEADKAGTAMMNVVRKMTIGGFAKKAQADAAKVLGLDLPTIAKQMQKDAPKALKTVLKAIAKQPKSNQVALLSQFFGDEARAFAPLVGNIGLLDQALDSVADKTKYAGSAFREYVQRANTASNALQLLRNKIANVFEGAGERWLPTLTGGRRQSVQPVYLRPRQVSCVASAHLTSPDRGLIPYSVLTDKENVPYSFSSGNEDMNMARAKRSEKISGPMLAQIERHVGQLRILTRNAMVSLAPFRPHYDAIHDLNQDLTKALNLLNDRPADYEEPHHAPFSQSGR